MENWQLSIIKELKSVLQPYKLKGTKLEMMLWLIKLNMRLPEVKQFALDLQKLKTYDKNAKSRQNNSRRRHPVTGKVSLGRHPVAGKV